MPSLSDYQELDLTGMNIDSIEWSGAKLSANYGDGYGDAAVVGNAYGLHRWKLSSGALPDSTTYGTIESKSWFDYYWSFFKDHTTGAQEIFLITFRGRKYFASFVETQMSVEMFTSNLFAGGVEIRQRRVEGFYESTDGGIFDPSLVAAGVWAWHKSEIQESTLADGATIASDWPNLITANPDLGVAGTVNTYETNELYGRPCVRLNGTDSYFSYGVVTKTIYEALFLFKCRDAVWANFSGILTGYDTTGGNAALVSGNGGTTLTDLSFTGYSYWKNGALLTPSTQNTPHEVYGVIHAKWTSGVSLVRPQIGWDRDIAARFAHIDIAEIILCDAALSADVSTDLDNYMNFRRTHP